MLVLFDYITGVVVNPLSQLDLPSVESCSVCVPGDPHRTGIRQTTGYMSSTKDYRTGQRWEPLALHIHLMQTA